MFAYSGSYTAESERVIHHVDMSWNEAWSGADQVRCFTVDEHTLTCTSAQLEARSAGASLSTM
jgi:hypothetical protein